MKHTFTDQQIVDGLRGKDAPTVDAIVRFLYAQCERSTTRLVTSNRGTEADADDLFQEVMLAFLQNTWDGRFQVRPDVKVTTYIYGIARTMWLKELGRSAARGKRTDQYVQALAGVTTTAGPEQELMDAEEIQSAWAIFGRLGETCQQILRAFYFDKLTMQQIAEQYGLGTEDNAKTRKYRCVLALRKHMTP